MNDQLVIGRAATLMKLAVAAVAKVLAAVSAFALTLLVTRNFESSDAGLFLLGFTILAVMSVVVRQGLDTVLLRYLSSNGMGKPRRNGSGHVRVVSCCCCCLRTRRCSSIASNTKVMAQASGQAQSRALPNGRGKTNNRT